MTFDVITLYVCGYWWAALTQLPTVRTCPAEDTCSKSSINHSLKTLAFPSTHHQIVVGITPSVAFLDKCYSPLSRSCLRIPQTPACLPFCLPAVYYLATVCLPCLPLDQYLLPFHLYCVKLSSKSIFTYRRLCVCSWVLCTRS